MNLCARVGEVSRYCRNFVRLVPRSPFPARQRQMVSLESRREQFLSPGVRVCDEDEILCSVLRDQRTTSQPFRKFPSFLKLIRLSTRLTPRNIVGTVGLQSLRSLTIYVTFITDKISIYSVQFTEIILYVNV